jgi:hypothetical protein
MKYWRHSPMKNITTELYDLMHRTLEDIEAARAVSGATYDFAFKVRAIMAAYHRQEQEIKERYDRP